MTTPHLMNCQHSDEGWCLQCVKPLHKALAECVDLLASLPQSKGSAGLATIENARQVLGGSSASRRVLVCGGRGYSSMTRLYRVLDELHSKKPITEIITGGASGADTLAEQWAVSRRVDVAIYRADWDKYGRAAGPKRNTKMLVEGKPDLVVKFLGGRGTANMVSQAKARGVRVLVY